MVVSYAGSVFGAGELIAAPFRQEVEARLPGSSIVEPEGDPLAGALLLAELAEELPDEPGILRKWRVNEALERMRGGLVVSVQAAPGSPLAAPEHLAAIARAVEAGGAVGIRTEGVETIRAIREAVGVPVIGLVKRRTPGTEVYITPELADALAVAEAGADLVAVDATERAAGGRDERRGVRGRGRRGAARADRGRRGHGERGAGGGRGRRRGGGDHALRLHR